MLLALTRPSRSADLVRIDTRFVRVDQEGLRYTHIGLAKQQQPGSTTEEVCHPWFEEDPILCPVTTAQAYLQ